MNKLVPLGIIAKKKGLDEADRTPAELDQEHPRRVAALDCGQILLGELLVILGLLPPTVHMLSPQPLVQERQVDSGQFPKAQVGRHAGKLATSRCDVPRGSALGCAEPSG